MSMKLYGNYVKIIWELYGNCMKLYGNCTKLYVIMEK